MKKYLKKKRFYILLITLIMFLVITIFVLKKGVLDIDIKSYEFIKNNLINDNLTRYMYVITNLGGAILLILFTLLMAILVKDKRTIIVIIINVLLVFVFNWLLKIIFQRARPDSINWLINEKGYSFPSGHSMVSMAYYGFLSYLVYLSKMKYKYLIITGLIFVSLLVGFSRIYLGVHYLSDVLAGFLMAIFYLVFFITSYNHYIKLRKK